MIPGGRRTRRQGSLATALVVAVAVLGATFLSASAGAVTTASTAVRQGQIPAPATSVSADGRTATDGTRTLSASQATDIAPSGQTVTVTGSGYDTYKGVYVAFCVIPPTNSTPTPCGGGVDKTGTTGASGWFSSNPPPEGVGLALPYGPGGSFSVAVNLSPMINNVDCRRVRCAIVTRNDHTRGSDRGQDIFLPVTFAEPGAPSDPSGPVVPDAPDGPAPTVTTTTTTTVVDQALPAPVVTLSADGRTATAGTITLEVSKATELDPVGEPVTVAGTGFDEAKGIGVAFCVIGPEGAAPGPCADGSPLASSAVAWISSDSTPEAAAALPFGPNGSFDLTVATSPTIGDVDCRQVSCGVVTSNDASRPSDRSQDIIIPVTFAAPVVVTTVAPTVTTDGAALTLGAEPASSSSGSSGVGGIVIVLVVIVVVAGGVALLVVQRRRRSATEVEA